MAKLGELENNDKDDLKDALKAVDLESEAGNAEKKPKRRSKKTEVLREENAESGKSGSKKKDVAEVGEPESELDSSEEKSLEELFGELDELLEKMEKEERLEESFRLYKNGVSLLQRANESIERVEKQVRVLDEEGILS